MPTRCQLLIELTPVIADVILIVGWLVLIQAIRNCVDPIGTAAVATLSALGLYALGSCFASGTTTRTGAPTR
jgi:hypothetical protein